MSQRNRFAVAVTTRLESSQGPRSKQKQPATHCWGILAACEKRNSSVPLLTLSKLRRSFGPGDYCPEQNPQVIIDSTTWDACNGSLLPFYHWLEWPFTTSKTDFTIYILMRIVPSKESKPLLVVVRAVVRIERICHWRWGLGWYQWSKRVLIGR